jgi:hypothetical protein
MEILAWISLNKELTGIICNVCFAMYAQFAISLVNHYSY